METFCHFPLSRFDCTPPSAILIFEPPNAHHKAFSDALGYQMVSFSNDGRDAFLVMSSAYYKRTCLWSADIFTSVWQEKFLFL